MNKKGNEKMLSELDRLFEMYINVSNQERSYIFSALIGYLQGSFKHTNTIDNEGLVEALEYSIKNYLGGLGNGSLKK